MNSYEIFQVIIYVLLLLILAPPIGVWMAKVLSGKSHLLLKPLAWLEKLIYRFSGVDSLKSMNWKEYSIALIIFNALGFSFVFLLQILQQYLPLNPQALSNTSLHLAFNTAVSFMTNTNWQAYGGESTMSYLTQMLGLGVQNFLSAATGIAVFIALVRGLTNNDLVYKGSSYSQGAKVLAMDVNRRIATVKSVYSGGIADENMDALFATRGCAGRVCVGSVVYKGSSFSKGAKVVGVNATRGRVTVKSVYSGQLSEENINELTVN